MKDNTTQNEEELEKDISADEFGKLMIESLQEAADDATARKEDEEDEEGEYDIVFIPKSSK